MLAVKRNSANHRPVPPVTERRQKRGAISPYFYQPGTDRASMRDGGKTGGLVPISCAGGAADA